MTTVARTTVLTVTVDGVGPVPVTVTEHGAGRPFLLLHGGAGPQSVAEFADLLGPREPARVLVPTHPGFGGTPRPEGLGSMRALARLYERTARPTRADRRDRRRELHRRLDRGRDRAARQPAGQRGGPGRRGRPGAQRPPRRRLLLADHGPGSRPQLLPPGRLPPGPGPPARPAEGDDGRQPGRAAGLRRAGHGRPRAAGPPADRRDPGARDLGRGRPDDPGRARPGLRRGHPGRPVPAHLRGRAPAPARDARSAAGGGPGLRRDHGRGETGHHG